MMPPTMRPTRFPISAAALLATALSVGGCAGRQDVTTGPDQAEAAPALPGAAPQQYPGASELPGQRERVAPPGPSFDGSPATRPSATPAKL